jgi:hypothetical protein
VISGIAGVGIGLLVGLLARPFLEAYMAARTTRAATHDVVADEALDRAPLP